MKIRSIQIKNFKTLKNTVITDCANFHILFGGPGSGKTNMIDAFRLLRNLGKEVPNARNLVTHEVKIKGTIEIDIQVLLEIEEVIRAVYLSKFFHLTSEQVHNSGHLLKYVCLTFSIVGTEGNRLSHNSDNHVVLTEVTVSDTTGDLFPILERQIQERTDLIRIALLKDDSVLRFNEASLDDSLRMMIQKSSVMMTAVEFIKTGSGFLQKNIAADFVGMLRFGKDDMILGNASPGLTSKLDKSQRNLIDLVHAIYQNNAGLFAELESECKLILTNLKSIQPRTMKDGKEIVLSMIEGSVIISENGGTDLLRYSHIYNLIDIINFVFMIGSSGAHKIWFLDDPPGVRRHSGHSFVQFLLRTSIRDKQIFVATSNINVEMISPKYVTCLYWDKTAGTRVMIPLNEIISGKKQVDQDSLNELAFHVNVCHRIYQVLRSSESAKKTVEDEKLQQIAARVLQEIVDVIKSYFELGKYDIIHFITVSIKSKLHDYGYSLEEQNTMAYNILQIFDEKTIEQAKLISRQKLKPSEDESFLDHVLSEEESEELEFKSSLRVPTEPSEKIKEIQRQIDKCTNTEEKLKLESKLKEAEVQQKRNVEHSVIKTVAAFLNTHGGTLLIGVTDGKQILGIEGDYETFKDKKNWDGWQKHVKDLLKENFGAAVSAQICVKSVPRDGKTVAVIKVHASERPVFIDIKDRNGKSEDEFYVRNSNQTDSLSKSQTVDYIKDRWKTSS